MADLFRQYKEVHEYQQQFRVDEARQIKLENEIKMLQQEHKLLLINRGHGGTSSGYDSLLEAASKENFTYGKIQEEREINRQLKFELNRLQNKRKIQQKEWKLRDSICPPTPIVSRNGNDLLSPRSSTKSSFNKSFTRRTMD